jgi:serine/threonine-protein kinase
MPSIGESLAGRYRLDAVIGTGAFATVFRAHDLRLDRDVAVKVLLAGEAADPVVAARFDQEARVLAAVDHPNVVTIHDVSPGGPVATDPSFFVMDLCDSGSLADSFAAVGNGGLHPDELVPILEDAAAGVAALHAIGIVHRDLKPSNILLAHGRARIADLGIALVGPSELTAVGTTVGTLAYLAPEQLAGVPASPASDVHALGIVTFLGLTGGLPRPTGSVAEAVAASVRPAPRVSTLRPGLGTAFDAVVADALAVDPVRRPTAAELGAALAMALERGRGAQGSAAPVVPLPATPPAEDDTTVLDAALPYQESPTESSSVGRRREPWLLGVGGGLVAAVAIGVAALVLPGLGRPGGAGSPGATVGADAGASKSATASPIVSPSSPTAATAAPTHAPSVAPDAYSEARAAGAGMRAAIEAARGPGGLNGHERKDLDSLLSRFDRALDKGEPQAAREVAGKVAEQVAGLVRGSSVDEGAGAGLEAAADRLVATASALPD